MKSLTCCATGAKSAVVDRLTNLIINRRHRQKCSVMRESVLYLVHIFDMDGHI